MANSGKSKSKSSKKEAGIGLGSLGGFALASAGAWLLYSRFGVNHNLPLLDAIPADREVFISKNAGRLSYYVDCTTAGRPLVLLHSVNAAASAYEMGPLFNHYRGLRPVYALDLPGYGFSDRSQRIYSPQMYEEAICDLLVNQVGHPVDIISLSLSSEFAARASLRCPELVHSLTMISPSGLDRLSFSSSSQQMQKSGLSNAIHPLVSFPLWGKALFDAIASHSSIEFFLQKSFIGHVPPGLIEYAYSTAHQKNAENAPLYFLSGKLFTPSVRTQVYERMKTPTLVIYDRDPYSRFQALQEVLLKNPAWQAVRLVPSLGMPQFERPADTVEVIDDFWKGIK